MEGSYIRSYYCMVRSSFFFVTLVNSIRLQEDISRVERKLLEPMSIKAITDTFFTAKAADFECVLENMQKMVNKSSKIATVLSKVSFQQRLVQKLTHKKATVRTSLLRLLKSILDTMDSNMRLDEEMLRVLAKIKETDSGIIVRELARSILKQYNSAHVFRAEQAE